MAWLSVPLRRAGTPSEDSRIQVASKQRGYEDGKQIPPHSRDVARNTPQAHDAVSAAEAPGSKMDLRYALTGTPDKVSCREAPHQIPRCH